MILEYHLRRVHRDCPSPWKYITEINVDNIMYMYVVIQSYKGSIPGVSDSH